MAQEILVILTILGTVIGSGFISGKEIVVFFSRFGMWSFFCIFLSFFLFFLLFKLLLNVGEKVAEKLKNNKFYLIANIILCVIFSAAMYGGIINLLNFDNIFIKLLILSIILIFCFIIFKKGLKSLNKFNLFLVPSMMIIFLVLLLPKLKGGMEFSLEKFGGASVFYSVLYCVLNTSNGSVIISSLGQKLSSKQKTRVALISALVLSAMLALVNFVLLSHPASFDYGMPVLSIFSGVGFIIMNIVIFLGCLTTLFSLTYSCASTFRDAKGNEYLNFLISIALPFFVSLLGFSFVVEFLYPLASVLGGFLLSQLLFISFFKRADKKIHAGGKKA